MPERREARTKSLESVKSQRYCGSRISGQRIHLFWGGGPGIAPVIPAFPTSVQVMRLPPYPPGVCCRRPDPRATGGSFHPSWVSRSVTPPTGWVHSHPSIRRVDKRAAHDLHGSSKRRSSSLSTDNRLTTLRGKLVDAASALSTRYQDALEPGMIKTMDVTLLLRYKVRQC